jgi:hypothetical protein
MMSGLAGSLMSGMATGVGMSLANRAVDAVLGGRETVVVHKQQTETTDCSKFEDLLKSCTMDCQPYVDALQKCRA